MCILALISRTVSEQNVTIHQLDEKKMLVWMEEDLQAVIAIPRAIAANVAKNMLSYTCMPPHKSTGLLLYLYVTMLLCICFVVISFNIFLALGRTATQAPAPLCHVSDLICRF